MHKICILTRSRFCIRMRNYEVNAKIGRTVRRTKRFVAALDIGPGSNFSRQHELPKDRRKNINKRADIPYIRNATVKHYPFLGQ